MAASRPTMRAFTVIKREDQEDFWLPIGAAFKHQSGDGYNIVLQALPIPDRDGQCKIVLRPPKDEKDPSRSSIEDAPRERTRERSRK